MAQERLMMLNEMFTGTPMFRFNRHMDRLFLDISWGADGQITLHLSESDRQVYQQIGDKFTPLLSLGKAVGHSYMYLLKFLYLITKKI